MSLLTQFASGLSSGPMITILEVLLILVFGHLGVKSVKLLFRKIALRKTEDITKKDIKRREDNIRLTGNILDGAVITAAVFYLNPDIGNSFFSGIITNSPNVLSALLIAVLGIILINIIVRVLEDFLGAIGVKSYLREIGLSNSATKIFSVVAKALLYLLLIQVVLNELNLGYTYLEQFFTAAAWALAFLIAGLVFYSLKDLVQNIAAGFYLKNSRLVRPGEEVKLDNDTGEIKEVNLFATSVNTDTGYTQLTPNKKVMNSSLKFKRTQSDLETLEDITKYFVAQNPSYCGPASAEMALEILGFRHDQEEIGDASNVADGEGVEEDEMMTAVEDLTEGEVKTAWIGYDDITNLADEYKSWFNDGALIISNYFKPEIFPNATAGHFVLSVGVEGDEILNLDPSGTNGGVYYVDEDTLEGAMAEHGHKRGYIVLAPKGTTAHWRIKNDLIYADKNLYDELSKTLESRLRKILRQGRILKNSTPQSMDKYLEKWGSDEKLSRVWKPEGYTGDKEKLGGDEDEASEDN